MPRITEFVCGQIIALLEEGLSQRHIAQQLRVSRRSVQRISARYRETGQVQRRIGSGRLRLTTDREDRRIIRTVMRNPTLSSRRIRADAGVNHISDRTLRNRLHESGLRSRMRARVPMLTLQHRRNRLTYATEHQHWTDRDWRRVWFSDESRFCLFNSDRRIRIWRRRGTRYVQRNLHGIRAFNGGSVMVWGAISYDSRTELVLLPIPTCNAERYVREILRPHILPLRRRLGRNFIFMQDNARPHTAATTRQFLEENDITVLNHPPVSPDLNPIEHVWDIMGQALRDMEVPPMNLHQLGEVLINIWNEIPQHDIQVRINMPERLREVVRQRGGNTRY